MQPRTQFKTLVSRLHALSSDNYKLIANVHHQTQNFNTGDYVMICLCLEHYIYHSFKGHMPELLSCFLSYIHEYNAYLLDLPGDMNTNHVFHVDDLTPYRGTFQPPCCLQLFLQVPSLLKFQKHLLLS